MKLNMFVYLHTKFHVSSIILTSFKQGVAGSSPPPPHQNGPLKSPPRLRLNQTILVLMNLFQ